jgi:hypothetical protein
LLDSRSDPAGRRAIYNVHGDQARPEGSPPAQAMDIAERMGYVATLAVELGQLITLEEQDLYPVLDHFQDLAVLDLKN